MLAQGKLEPLQDESPLPEGKQLDVKLVEVGLYDAAAGVGKVDGTTVAVGDAARLVGKKVKVRITRVLDGTAYAALVSGGPEIALPITAEGEAEKPTRAPRTRKPGAEAEAEPEAEEVDAEPIEAEAEAEP
ncbi:MAG: TRAM domain-containing protein, partial [Thermoplasmatota archaeon]